MLTRDGILKAAGNGKFFALEFTKANGENRKMIARLGVKSHLKGGTKSYSDKEKNILTVFDMEKLAYRSVRVDRITKLKVKGEVINVTEA